MAYRLYLKLTVVDVNRLVIQRTIDRTSDWLAFATQTDGHILVNSIIGNSYLIRPAGALS